MTEWLCWLFVIWFAIGVLGEIFDKDKDWEE